MEIDDAGKVIRSVGTADPAFADALLMPYGLVVIPAIDRVVSTNSSMHDDDLLSGVTYQVWRLSDLKLLKTAYFDPGDNRYAHISPEEPRLGPDGSVFVQTLACGIQRITNIDTDTPQAKLVFTFPGNWCGVPTIVGRYLIQSVPAINGFIVLDIANAARPREVSRLTLSDVYSPHWTAWDPKTQRLVATSGSTPADRMYLLKLDQATGALSVDDAFRDQDGKNRLQLRQSRMAARFQRRRRTARSDLYALSKENWLRSARSRPINLGSNRASLPLAPAGDFSLPAISVVHVDHNFA